MTTAGRRLMALWYCNSTRRIRMDQHRPANLLKRALHVATCSGLVLFWCCRAAEAGSGLQRCTRTVAGKVIGLGASLQRCAAVLAGSTDLGGSYPPNVYSIFVHLGSQGRQTATQTHTDSAFSCHGRGYVATRARPLSGCEVHEPSLTHISMAMQIIISMHPAACFCFYSSFFRSLWLGSGAAYVRVHVDSLAGLAGEIPDTVRACAGDLIRAN